MSRQRAGQETIFQLNFLGINGPKQKYLYEPFLARLILSSINFVIERIYWRPPDFLWREKVIRAEMKSFYRKNGINREFFLLSGWSLDSVRIRFIYLYVLRPINSIGRFPRKQFPSQRFQMISGLPCQQVLRLPDPTTIRRWRVKEP